MKVKIVLTALLISLLSCNDNIPITQQRVFFEVHYINYAWMYTNQGILIDSLGNIYDYNVTQAQKDGWKSADKDGYISRTDMNKNFAFCNHIIHHVGVDSLQYYVNKIDDAARGTLSEPVSVMADAGILQYIAYIYNEKKDSYKQILLLQWGDTQCTNSSPAASEISEWLIKMDKYNYNK